MGFFLDVVQKVKRSGPIWSQKNLACLEFHWSYEKFGLTIVVTKKHVVLFSSTCPRGVITKFIGSEFLISMIISLISLMSVSPISFPRVRIFSFRFFVTFYLVISVILHSHMSLFTLLGMLLACYVSGCISFLQNGMWLVMIALLFSYTEKTFHIIF
jgi:hypothetical protein